jgi:NitT/TauT family transport system substrate-binding protein
MTPGRGPARARARTVGPRGARAVIGLVMLALLLAACRPAIIDTESGAPGETIDTSTPSAEPAAKLQPDVQVSVEIRLFRGFGPADAPLQYAQALDLYRPVNLVVDLAPPIAGYDPFQVDPAADVVAVWIGAVADIAPAATRGMQLEAVGEVSGRDTTVLVTKGKAQIKLAALKGKTVLADTAAAAASLRAALANAGVAPSSVDISLPDDPSAPFDPSALFAGTEAAAAVSVYDGWARIQEGAVAAGEDPAAYHAQSLRDPAHDILGELVWVQKSDMSDPRLHAAVAALLATLGKAQVSCRDAVEDCAGAAAAQSDRTPEGIAWSIDQLDRLLWPTQDGILHVDQGAWDRTLAAMKAADVAGADALTVTNDIVDQVLAVLRPTVDVNGTDWKPRTDLPLLP